MYLGAHLYIENELNKLLRKSLKYPDDLIGTKMRFIDKLRLVFAMGIIPMEEMEVMVKVNKLRNSFSHNLDYVINESIVNDIIDSLSDRRKVLFSLTHKDDGDLTDKLRRVFLDDVVPRKSYVKRTRKETS